MKRPFTVIGFTGFSALLVLFLCQSIQLAEIILSSFAVLGVISLFNKSSRQAMLLPVGLFTVAAACLLFISVYGDTVNAQSLAGEKVAVEAVVAEAPYMKKQNGRYYCVLRLDTVGGEKTKGRLRLSFSPAKDKIDPDVLEIGSKISFTGKVYIPAEEEKSISRYFAGESIVLGACWPKNVTTEGADIISVTYIFSKIRHYVSDVLRYGLGDKTAGLIIGILTGDKSCLDDKLYEGFRKTGVAHLMAVSGLHLSLWVFSLGAIIPEGPRASKLKYLLLAFAVIFVMLLAGMSESVKRSGFMALVYLMGKLSKRRSDALNSLGFAVTIMLLYNPASVLSISLQLSFLSTLGILTLGSRFIKMSTELFGSKKINNPFKRLLRYCADIFFISISVLVFTFPVLIYAFGGISTVSAWVNMLITFAVMPLLLLSGAYALTSGISFVAYPLAVTIKLISSYIISVTQLFMKVKNAFLVFEKENLLLYIAASVIICYLCMITFKRNYRGFASALICVAVSAGLIITSNALQVDNAVLHLKSYDEVTAIAIEKEGDAVLLNALPEYEKGLFASYLEEKGVSLSAFAESDGTSELICSADGKHISSGKTLGLFDKVKLIGNGEYQRIKAYGKYIHIFYTEALQCDHNCDIMIRILDNDTTLSVNGKDFSLNDEKSISVTLDENKLTVRGKSKWLNLMKSS